MEGVPATAVCAWPADGASGAGDLSGIYGEAVPDAEAVEPAPLCKPEWRLLLSAPHGFIGLCPAATGEPGEATMELGGEAGNCRLKKQWKKEALQASLCTPGSNSTKQMG